MRPGRPAEDRGGLLPMKERAGENVRRSAQLAARGAAAPVIAAALCRECLFDGWTGGACAWCGRARLPGDGVPLPALAR